MFDWPSGIREVGPFHSLIHGLPCRSASSQKLCDMLRRQDKDRRWRANYKRLEREVNSIEEDEYQLERVYPQVSARA